MVNNQKHVFLTALFLSLLPLFLSAQRLETTIAVGSYPYALVYNLIHNKVYCANLGFFPVFIDSTVTVIDGATNYVLTTITVGDYPLAFAWNPVQNRTYVANYQGSSISVLRDVVGIEEDNFAPVERDIFTTTLF
ncbi:MAG: YncE family protein, partial [candidate division WOR-3 bacterium]